MLRILNGFGHVFQCIPGVFCQIQTGLYLNGISSMKQQEKYKVTNLRRSNNMVDQKDLKIGGTILNDDYCFDREVYKPRNIEHPLEGNLGRSAGANFKATPPAPPPRTPARLHCIIMTFSLAAFDQKKKFLCALLS